jgi:hypothetical protein
MSVTIEESTAIQSPPNNLESLGPEDLADLATNPEMLVSVRAEVCRRLQDDPRKANILTFRWLMPANDADKADAFDGLIAVCWKATKKRIPYGLYPRGYAETYCDKRERLDGSIAQPAGGVVEETREAIKSELVDCLHDLSAPESVLRALSGGFETDVYVANALRRKAWKEPKHILYGGDEVSEDDEAEPLTLFEVTRDDPKSRTNAYNNLVEIIFQEKAQVVKELGEEGWTAWQEILELAENHIAELADNGYLSQTGKDCHRAITGVFERVYGVKARQARTLKNRLLGTFRRILGAVQANEGLRKSTPEELRAQSVFLPPVVPMELIRRTSGMPVMSRLLDMDDERLAFDDERSSVGRDVPPDEWRKIKARLKGEQDGE